MSSRSDGKELWDMGLLSPQDMVAAYVVVAIVLLAGLAIVAIAYFLAYWGARAGRCDRCHRSTVRGPSSAVPALCRSCGSAGLRGEAARPLQPALVGKATDAHQALVHELLLVHLSRHPVAPRR